MNTWTVRGIESRDRERWRELFAAYRAFYELAPDEAVLSTVWGWLADADHEVRGLVAVDDTDRPVGIAHVRTFARPSTASAGLFLDDLFTDPAVRGRGIGRALIDAVARLAAEEGSTKVRWITAATNTRARALYDSVASVDWVVYDLTPADG
ncbi:GNAT family N-acetyltransferase [Planctomonas sp. JC2975]|uniref:GNAT family N-acetyltransferase n=1 Tax=Planctomonas sp. JC2975 TaxID=2729626 RepID=UPI001472B418|nr:GNAT family N-acetyltransferase [Planctomonas sp. JC2975]NNC11059.1 GNAT family N-acetyltransferase [Planctomonas sp. JC2975]